MNVYSTGAGDPVTTTTTDWDGNANTVNSSGLPALTGSNFLTNGVDALWIPGSIAPEVDNARFNCTGPLTTVAQIRTALFNVANWTTSNDAPGFTMPTNCNYLGVFLPVQLISFQAQNNFNEVTAKWQVTN
jgi:hypothetical protein